MALSLNWSAECGIVFADQSGCIIPGAKSGGPCERHKPELAVLATNSGTSGGLEWLSSQGPRDSQTGCTVLAGCAQSLGQIKSGSKFAVLQQPVITRLVT